ncbi:MAG TPA: hypothetical protein P5119_04365 [Candidatus Aminicenantes bacterium]|nr:hypothetical protein [Candidatus Aminicenantes bacterium]HRY64558.1 hypothetical protein [Candidatus Aminicenantes bacterium]HRZ71471.1 hypothetical protein [Candidatus Aminicenantes bacterium]
MNARIGPIARPALAAAIFALAASAGPLDAAGPQAKPGRAVVLEYKMPAGRSLTYQYSQEMTQAMEAQGQAVDSQVSVASAMTFRAKGPKGRDLLVGATIDDMRMTVSTNMTGDMSPDMSEAKGKSFDMVLSPLGAEIDSAGAEAVTYSVAGEAQNVSAYFKAFFPDLLGKPVKVGDTWPSSDKIDQGSAAMKMHVENQYVHTLEGFETVDGLECARISAQVTGTVSGSGSQGGMDMTMSGANKGQTVWFFAVKEGIFVKAVNETTADVAVDLAAAGLTIPVTEKIKTEIKLTGRS